MKLLKNLLPHLCLVLAGTFVTFYIVDRFNPEMAFINNPASKLMLLVFCILAIAVSVMLILRMRRDG